MCPPRSRQHPVGPGLRLVPTLRWPPLPEQPFPSSPELLIYWNGNQIPMPHESYGLAKARTDARNSQAETGEESDRHEGASDVYFPPAARIAISRAARS